MFVQQSSCSCSVAKHERSTRIRFSRYLAVIGRVEGLLSMTVGDGHPQIFRNNVLFLLHVATRIYIDYHDQLVDSPAQLQY